MSDSPEESLMRHVLALVAALLTASGAPRASQIPGERFQLARSASGLAVVPATIGDVPVRLGIDTGTSRTLVNAQVAARLRLAPTERLSVAGAATGDSAALCGPAPDIRIGAMAFGLDCLGWVPGETRLAGAEDVDGLLGADALAHFDLWIDVTQTPPEARFAPPGSLGAWMSGRPIALEILSRRAVVSAELVPIDSHAVSARLVLDSGANALVLVGAAANDFARAMRPAQRPGLVHTTTSRRPVPLAVIRGLWVGGARLDVRTAALMTEIANRAEDGLLPLAALGPVLIDMTNKQLRRGSLRR